MRVKYSPRVNDDILSYTFDNDVITAEINGVSDTFDFRQFGDGIIENPEEDILTILDPNPILSVERENGILSVVLLSHISAFAPYEDRFPEWIEV